MTFPFEFGMKLVFRLSLPDAALLETAAVALGVHAASLRPRSFGTEAVGDDTVETLKRCHTGKGRSASPFHGTHRL